MVALIFAWVALLIILLAGVAAAALAARERLRALAVAPLVPVGLAALLVWFGGLPPVPGPLPALAGLALCAIGVLGGGPLAAMVLRLATESSPGRHGGIVVGTLGDGTEELLRGGTVIGYLERLGTVAAIAIGYPEALAVIVAVKGLGRFSELRGAEVRERFIIGTLTSLTWAGVCGTVVAAGING